MEHKLIISLKYTVPNPYRKNLRASEFPRGIALELSFVAENIGDNEFPGGTLKGVSINYGTETVGGLRTFRDLNATIDSIKKGKQRVILVWPTIFKIPGLAWIKCTLELKNKEDSILLFQSVTDTEPTKSVWQNAYAVIDRENLEIMELLRGINSKLNKLTRKQK